MVEFKIKNKHGRLPKRALNKNKNKNMKKKLGFIMPRLIGATVLVGLAAFVITTLFKLLLGITLIAGAITLIARKASSRRKKWIAQYGQGAVPDFGNRNTFGNNRGWANQMQPISGHAAPKGATIVPIN